MKRLQIALAIFGLIAGFFAAQHLSAQPNQAQTNPQIPFSQAVSLSPEQLLTSGSDGEPVESGGGDGSSGIQATERISIPYGFETPLPTLYDGQEVVASGHGGCTANQQATVAVTITQTASGAVATGEFDQTCTGELQTWRIIVTNVTTNTFTADAAEACGLATTREGGYVTDTYDWCKDVELIRLDQRMYVPSVLRD